MIRTACHVLPASLLLLAACSDPVRDAERRLEMVEHSSAGAAELCAAARAVPEAYLAKGDTTGYQEAVVSADIKCHSAELDEQMGIFRDVDGKQKPPIRADDMSDLPDTTSSAEGVSDATANSD